MADERLQSLVEGLLLGTLTPSEKEDLRLRLEAGDALAAEACQEVRRLLTALPNAIPQNAPPAALKQRLLETAAREARLASAEKTSGASQAAGPATMRPMPQRTFVQSMARSLAWAAGFLLFAVGLAYYYRTQEIRSLQRERAQLLEQLQARQQEIEGLKLSLALHVEMTKTLQKSKTLLVDLKSTKENAARGKVIVDREKNAAYFIAADLAALEAGKDYQLWYIGASGPVDAGVFQVDAGGYGVVAVRNLPQNLSEISAFAVTIEPKGGSVNPTLAQMVLLGRV